ncbi:ribosome assembly RNA-binding protein YhbY [Thiolapillus sp.]
MGRSRISARQAVPNVESFVPLSNPQIRHLRGLAHSLKPVVMIGQHGLRDAVLEEIGIALGFHELIKVKVSAGDRDERDEIIRQITNNTRAELVQRIGNMAVLFRRNHKKPRIVLP